MPVMLQSVITSPRSGTPGSGPPLRDSPRGEPEKGVVTRLLLQVGADVAGRGCDDDRIVDWSWSMNSPVSVSPWATSRSLRLSR
jgi:hypothetical protein